MLSTAECQLLMDAVEERMATGIYSSFSYGAKADSVEIEPLERFPVCCLSSEAQELSENILRHRVLPFLEERLPHVAEQLFGRSSDLGELSFKFSNNEPAVNRYIAGGEFAPHKDGYRAVKRVGGRRGEGGQTMQIK